MGSNSARTNGQDAENAAGRRMDAWKVVVVVEEER